MLSTALIIPLELAKLAFFVAYIATTIGVVIGVYWENERFSKDKQELGWRLLILSLSFDVFFTVLVFGTDGWISAIQHTEIIGLETRLAPRFLTKSEEHRLIRAFSAFSGESIFLATNADDPEALALANQIRSVFINSHWNVSIWKNSHASEANTAVGILIEEFIAVPPVAQTEVAAAEKAISVIMNELDNLGLQPNGPRKVEIGNTTTLIRLTIGRKNP